MKQQNFKKVQPGHSFDEKFLVVLIIDVDFILFVWLSAPNAYLY